MVTLLWLAKKEPEKFIKGNVTKKNKGKPSFLYATQCLNLIYNAIKLHYDIPKGYLNMGCAKVVLEDTIELPYKLP